METISYIPDFPPQALPLPLWAVQALLVVGFFLHVIPMNIALAGGYMSWAFMLGGDKKSNLYKVGRYLALSLPVIVSFAITQGIVPLLFLQLMFGPLYYTSSIQIAIPWIAVIILLLIGYYVLYIFKYQEEKLGKWAPWLLLVSSLFFTVIGLIFSSNMSLMLQPEKWQPMTEAASSGFELYLNSDVLARYLHFFVSAFAVAALFVGCFGYFSKDQKFSKWAIQLGSGIFAVVTLSQIGFGGWFLMTLPREIMFKYMGQDQLGTISFGLSMVLMVLSLIAALVAWKSGGKISFGVATVTAMLTILFMIVMRHMLRFYMTQEFFKPELLNVDIQWDILVAFLLLAVALIVYLVWLVRLTWTAYRGEK